MTPLSVWNPVKRCRVLNPKNQKLDWGRIMRELTFEEFCALPMELGMHVSGDKEHYLHRYNRETNVNKVVITKKKKSGGFGKSSTIYYFPNEVEHYTTADQIYVAYMEQVCGVKS